MSERLSANQVKIAFRNTGFENIRKCVHCGLCGDSCPTYRESGLEQDSPRGRLFIMDGLYRGKLSFTAENIKYLDQCIDCRACETACPSKVPYGELIEKTRGILKERVRSAELSVRIQSFFYEKILPSDRALLLLSSAFRISQKLRIQKLLQGSVFKKILPTFIVKGQAIMPEFSGKSFKKDFCGIHTPKNPGKKMLRVAMFSGCVADVSDREVQEATLRLLLKAGCQVHIPQNQSCCGALQVHGGDRKTGRKMAKKNYRAFVPEKPDAVITNSGGCSAQLKEYHLLFSGEDRFCKEVNQLESKITDILQFLSICEGFSENQNWKKENTEVFYDAPCHLLHAQKVDQAPQNLLSSIPNLKLIPLDESEHCCGSGGIYNLLQRKIADQVLGRKIASIRRAMKKHPNAKTVVTGNSGCLFQIRYGIKKAGLNLCVTHPAVLINSLCLD